VSSKPGAGQTAERLINDIRNNPDEGSQHSYVDLEKLAKKWNNGTPRGTMRRGFFRLWLVLSIIWFATGAWLLWDDLTGNLRPEELAAHVIFGQPLPERTIHALELVLLPQLGLLVLGCAGVWVVRGFRS
jgi:hypothetical protein